MPKSPPSLRDQVELFRDQIAGLRLQRRRVERDLPDRARIMAAISRWEKEAEARLDAQVNVASLLRPADGRPSMAGRIDLAEAAAAVAARELADRHRDAVEHAFAKAGADGLTPEARAARLAQIDAQILDAGKSEEIAIRAAEAEGAPILRRADADPRIVLAFDQDLER